MNRRHIEELPTDHRRVPNGFVFLGIDDNGVEFDLRIQNVRKRLSSSGLVKAQMKSMSRGRPLQPSDLYEDETTISLVAMRKFRKDIRINPNGTYSIGHRSARSLREMVSIGLEEFSPRPRPPGP